VTGLVEVRGGLGISWFWSLKWILVRHWIYGDFYEGFQDLNSIEEESKETFWGENVPDCSEGLCQVANTYGYPCLVLICLIGIN
jgi:hypothetical protein